MAAAKFTLPDCPPGCEIATTPIGVQYIRRIPREPGTYFRVRHDTYGHEVIKAETAEEALKEFAKKVSPTSKTNKERLDKFSADCRMSSFVQPVPPKE